MTATVRDCTARTRCGSYCRQTYNTGRGCAPEPLPEHPRRDALAREGFQLLVTEQDTTGRAPEWNHLTEPDREKWRDNADAWAKVLADDAHKQIAARKPPAAPADAAEGRRLVYAPPLDATSDWFRRADTGTTSPPGVIQWRPEPTPAIRYAIHPDGTVTCHMGIGDPPTPPATLPTPPARDTRTETLHVVGGFVGRAVSYPRAAHGLPRAEAECVCDDPTPLPTYDPDHRDYNPHRVIPVDAWLRCLACRGLYRR